MTPTFILSTCGISSLTNTHPEKRNLIIRHANVKESEQLPPQDLQALEEIIEHAREKLLGAGPASVGALSAELNALAKYYERVFAGRQDFHQLLCTDTWLGEQAAGVVAEWLRSHGLTVDVRRQKDLQTEDIESFHLALSDLVHWCEETFSDTSNLRVVFNLTGGFKSVNGFLQALAMFYADEAFYIFESQPALLRLPRLPIELTADVTVRNHLPAFRRLAKCLPGGSIEAIPETLLMHIGGQQGLSPWGSLVWERTKKKVYSEQVWPSPSDRIIYDARFTESVNRLTSERKRQVNERIDDLAGYLETQQDIRSLRFHDLKGDPMPPSTHEFYAWSDGDAQRIFGHYQGDRFVLDRLEKHL